MYYLIDLGAFFFLGSIEPHLHHLVCPEDIDTRLARVLHFKNKNCNKITYTAMIRMIYICVITISIVNPLMLRVLFLGSWQTVQIQIRRHRSSDQGLHCLLAGISIKNKIKMKNTPDTPKMTNGLVQFTRTDKSTRQIWVKVDNIIIHERTSSGNVFTIHYLSFGMETNG